MQVRDSLVQTRFIKINKSFFESFGPFNERNERIDSGKDSFILMESHARLKKDMDESWG